MQAYDMPTPHCVVRMRVMCEMERQRREKMDNFNQLSPEQSERLALLMEELGEAQHAIGKILRHGFEEYHPDIPERTNRMDLEKELGHVRLAVSIMTEGGDLNPAEIQTYCGAKRFSVGEYLHHQDGYMGRD